MTRIVRTELELGRWTRAIRIPERRLRPLLDREYVGFRQETARFERWLEPPQPALTLMVSLEEPLRAGGVALPVAWVGGLNDTFDLVELGGRHASLDIKLTPLGAYRLLGLSLHELAATVVALDELFGAAGRRLTDRLRDAADWERRFQVLDAFLAARAGEGPHPRPGIARAWSRLCATDGRVRIGTLAAELDWSRRHLIAKFREQVGLPPKTVARLLRFRHLCRRLDADPLRWAEIAYDCGYTDQSHLIREFRRLAGTTPTDFLARRIPGGGVVGDPGHIRPRHDCASA